jgi:3-oxoacyl-[acyl-carrier-protein] synthase-3
MMSSYIAGVGSYVPPRVVTNQDLTQWMDTSDEWIQQRTGIKQRHWVDSPQVTTSDLAKIASERALESAGISAKEIDAIILATISPDHEFPGTSCFLQAKLGIPGVAAIDLRQACSGFIYALSVGDQFIRSGMYKNILVVGSELQSKGLDLTTRGRDISVLFGDGAGAVVLSRGKENPQDSDSQIYSTHLHADGSFAKELWIPAPGMAYPQRINAEMFENGDHFGKMNGKTVFVHAVKKMPEAVIEALTANKKSIQDVDLFLFHQANLRINEMVAKQLSIPEDRIFNTIDRFGNTTAATIPLGMDEAIRAGRLKKGMLVATAAFGSGFTWASALFRY